MGALRLIYLFDWTSGRRIGLCFRFPIHRILTILRLGFLAGNRSFGCPEVARCFGIR